MIHIIIKLELFFRYKVELIYIHIIIMNNNIFEALRNIPPIKKPKGSDKVPKNESHVIPKKTEISNSLENNSVDQTPSRGAKPIPPPIEPEIKITSQLVTPPSNNLEIGNLISGSESESEEEIKVKIVDYNKGRERTQTYSVSSGLSCPTWKRLLCFSVINGEYCTYGSHCTFAHTLLEQKIDANMLCIYQIILDKNLISFFSLTNPKTDEIYSKLLFLTSVCSKCLSGKCMGGYNCKYGAHTPCLKLCKNDLLTGGCINKEIEIVVDAEISNKINPSNKPDKYLGCLNGHHLSTRNLVPYYDYINKKNISKKTLYQSTRYIDKKQHVYNLNPNKKSSETSESTDEEISQWFKKEEDSSEDDDMKIEK
jgi:hypothetical protein